MGELEPSHLIGRRWRLNRDGNPHKAQLVVLYRNEIQLLAY